jgi:hypothetical protein
MAALDVIEASPVSRPCGGKLWVLATETRRLVDRMRDQAEDLLFEDHALLGFESEKSEPSTLPRAPEPEHPAPANRAAELREAILASCESTKNLAERLGLSVARVGRIRLKAGDRCAFLTGSALTAEQRAEIAASRELTSVLAARHSVAECLVNKIRKSGG